MLRIFSVLIIVLISSNLEAQLFDVRKRVDWSIFEYPLDKDDKLSVIKKLSGDLFWYLEDNELFEKNCDNFHFIDFNNDGLKDFLYEGYAGGENKVVIIYHQFEKGDFKKVFEQAGVPYSFKRIGLFGSSFEIQLLSNDGAFDGRGTVHTPYIFDLNRELRILDATIFHFATEFPSDGFQKKDFKIINPKYYLRISPEIENDIKDADVLFGNVVAEFGAGTLGYALGSKTDDTGRIWWFVAIRADENVRTIYQRTDGYYLGWMSSRYLEEL